MTTPAPFNVNAYFTAKPGRTRRAVTTAKRTLSIQASETHYCSPRSGTGPYSSVEVMVCDGPTPRAFITHKGGRAQDDVYGWMPVEIVEAVIAADGGQVQA